MAETFANNATGTLNGSITNVATSLVLNAGQGAAFPATGNFRILIDSEIIIVGARSGDTLSSLTRGQEGTAGAAHNNGATVTHILTKGALETLAQTPGAWTAYTPTLTATTTNPTLGTGPTQSGRWSQFGKLVTGQASIIFGTSPTAGSGTYLVLLPAAVASSLVIVGNFMVFDSSGSTWRAGSIQQGASNTTAVLVMGGGNLITDASPWVWAASDEIRYSFMYETT